MLLNVFPPLLIVAYLFLNRFRNVNSSLNFALIFLILILFVSKVLLMKMGGDVSKYFIYFNHINLESIILNGWLNGVLMIVIKSLFGSFIYFQLFVVGALITSVFHFSNKFFKDYSKTAALIILATPFVHGLITIHIIFSLAFSVALLAFTFLEKNKRIFIIIMLLSISIHWSTAILLPVVFFHKKFFWYTILIICVAFIFLLKDFLHDLAMGSFLEIWFDPKVERDFSPHHIYMYIFFVTISLFHYKSFRHNILNVPYINEISLQVMVYILAICLIFFDNPLVTVRLGIFLKLFFLTYILSLIKFLHFRNVRIMTVLIVFIFVVLSFNFSYSTIVA